MIIWIISKQGNQNNITMKIITITITKSTVLKDVSDHTWYTGRSKRKEDNAEDVSNIQVGADESDVLFRFFQQAYSNVLAPLSTVIVRPTTEVLTGDSEASIPENIVFNLAMNDMWDQSQLPVLSQNIHQHFVNWILGDWYTISSPEDASICYTKAQNNLEAIKSVIGKRTSPVRRCGVSF